MLLAKSSSFSVFLGGGGFCFCFETIALQHLIFVNKMAQNWPILYFFEYFRIFGAQPGVGDFVFFS